MWNKKNIHTRIKLCEFETLDSAFEASHLGADALGFHLFAHHDFGERVRRFSEILKHLPLSVEKVLLADRSHEEIEEFCSKVPINSIQLYPDWTIEQIQKLKNRLPQVKIIKVISAQGSENLNPNFEQLLSYYHPVCDAFLLDSWKIGGTGKIADWIHCAEIVRLSEKPVFLAGGLTSENVSEAISIVKPFGVDVENGVSDRIPHGPLVKNIQKCIAFVEAVKVADRTTTGDQQQSLGRLIACQK